MLVDMAAPTKKRVIIDPAVREAEEAFQRMLARFKSISREAHIAEAIRLGVRNEDGSLKLPENEPCSSVG